MTRLLEALAALLLVAGAALLLIGARLGSDRAGRLGCRDQLRRLGLAAITYADDKRFFPHVGPSRRLDGGLDSSDSARVFRALSWFGYLEGYDAWICPGSGDRPRAGAAAEAPAAMRAGAPWPRPAGFVAPPSPFQDGVADPRLDQATDLSYGWKRRHLSTGTRSTSLLAADRATRAPGGSRSLLPEEPLAGNHADVVVALQADATTLEVAATADEQVEHLVGQAPGSNGPLAILDPRGPRRPALAAAPSPGALLAGAGVVLFLALAGRREREAM